MSEVPPFTHTPPQEDPVPRSGASRKGKVEEALDKIARAEIDEPVETPTVLEGEVQEEGPNEAVVAVYTAPKSGGTSLRDVMPIFAEQPNGAEANETEGDEAKEEDVEEITEEELEQEIADLIQEETPHVPAVPPRAPGAEILRKEKESIPDYESMTFEELLSDKIAGPILERECWTVLQHNDRAWNRNDYGEQLTHDGYLKRKDGTKTELKPSMVVTPTPQGTPRGGNLIKLAVYRAKDKLGRRMQATGHTPRPQTIPSETTDSVTEANVEIAGEHIEPVAEELEAPKPIQEPQVLELEEVNQETSEEPTEEFEQETPVEQPGATESEEVAVSPEDSTERVDADEDSTGSEEQPKQIHHTLEIEQPHSPDGLEGSEGETSVASALEKKGEEVDHEEDVTKTESASVWRETREKYRALRAEMMQARADWEDAEEQYQGVRNGGILARMFDTAQLKEERNKKQELYLSLLEQLRAERENRMSAFMKERVKHGVYEEPTHMKEGEKSNFIGQEKASRYVAFHEALLDRRIDQDIVLIERMNAGVKQPESLARAWNGVRQFGRWYGSLSKKQRIALGAGIGFGIATGAALITGATLAGATVLGAVAGGRRAATSALFMSGIGGATVGASARRVHESIDSRAGKRATEYSERQEKDIKQGFSKRKLSETLDLKQKAKRNEKVIRAVGKGGAIVGAGAIAATVGVIAGRNIAESIHDALPEGVQQAMDTASATEAVKAVAEEATPGSEPGALDTSKFQTFPEVYDAKAQSIAAIQEATENANIVEEMETTIDNAKPVEELLTEEEFASETAKAQSFILPEQVVPPELDGELPATKAGIRPEFDEAFGNLEADSTSVPDTTSTEHQFPRNQLPETPEANWTTETYLREALASMEADEVGTIPNSPVPDEVLARAENFNAASQEVPSVHTVEKGDKIWKILESKLEARGSFEGMNEAQRIHLIDDLEDEIKEMSSDDLKKIGIVSGKADVIQVGEQIDLSNVLKDESVEKAVASAKGLSESQVNSILEQQKGTHTAGYAGAHENISKTELSGIQPEATNPAPFTSTGSQTPPSFTSISSFGEATEQVPLGSSIRSGDFPHAQAEFENATKLNAIPDINTDTSRSVVENLFHNHNIFSRTIEGNEKMFHANWNAISQLTMKDVFDGDGKLVLGGGRMSPTLLGADAERLVRTMIDQVADGMADRGVPNAQLLLTQAQQEDWPVGTFFEKIGEELETKTSPDVSPEPVATLASLDAPEAVAESGETPPPTPVEDVEKPQTQEPPPKKFYRPTRTERLIDIDVPLKPKEGLFGGKVDVEARAILRAGGGKPYQYIDVHMDDPISSSASGLIEEELLSIHPEWRDVTTRELIERDLDFKKVWLRYVGSEDSDPETVDNTRGSISKFGKSGSTPQYRAPIEPQHIEELKDMKGADALKQLEDQLEEYKAKQPQRPIRIQGNRVRIYPLKD